MKAIIETVVGIRVNWKEPLCNQPAIMEELSKMEAKGQIPTFFVSDRFVI